MNPHDLFPELSVESVLADPTQIDALYRRNVTALDRRIPLVLRPRSETEVLYAVRRANAQGVRLYPLSTGKNYGLGSKLPITDGCVVLDLSQMDRVLEVNEAGRYAVLEPGVTQDTLATYLRASHPALTFGLTGAPAWTSIAGNLLDRGDGLGPRIDDLLGVAGVLGDGTPFEAGGFAGSLRPAVAPFASRYGAGPDLVGVFSQSNIAVVTRVAFRLRPRPARRYVVWGAVAPDLLGEAVARLRNLGDQRAFTPGGVYLGYANRFVQAGLSPLPTDRADGGLPRGTAPAGRTEWQFLLLVDGTPRVADACRDEAIEQLAGVCREAGVYLVGSSADPRDGLPAFLHPLAQPLVGDPDTESVKLIYRATNTPPPADGRYDVDHTPFGMRCCMPVVPFVPECVLEAARITDVHRGASGLNIKTTFFGDGRTLVTVHFRTDDSAQVAAVDRVEPKLWDDFVAAGYLPYRASVQQMARTVAQRPEFFRLAARLILGVPWSDTSRS